MSDSQRRAYNASSRIAKGIQWATTSVYANGTGNARVGLKPGKIQHLNEAVDAGFKKTKRKSNAWSSDDESDTSYWTEDVGKERSIAPTKRSDRHTFANNPCDRDRDLRSRDAAPEGSLAELFGPPEQELSSDLDDRIEVEPARNTHTTSTVPNHQMAVVPYLTRDERTGRIINTEAPHLTHGRGHGHGHGHGHQRPPSPTNSLTSGHTNHTHTHTRQASSRALVVPQRQVPDHVPPPPRANGRLLLPEPPGPKSNTGGSRAGGSRSGKSRK